MRSGRRIQLSYSGAVIETINFLRDPTAQNENLTRLRAWLERQTETGLGPSPTDPGRNLLWVDVPGEQVARLLDGWRTAPNARRALADPMAKYIRARLTDGELIDWSVAVIHNATAQENVQLVGRSVGLTKRALHPEGSTSRTYDIRRLLSPPDERLDLSEAQYRLALSETQRLWAEGALRIKERPETPNGPCVRRVRPPQRGLLLLYMLDPRAAEIEEIEAIPALGISFPESPTDRPIEYMIPERYWDEFITT
jgi:hypothetical protein